VARSVVSRLLAEAGASAVQPELGGSTVAPPGEAARAGRSEPEPVQPVPDEAVPVDAVPVDVVGSSLHRVDLDP
jgi:hypothetical protein